MHALTDFLTHLLTQPNGNLANGDLGFGQALAAIGITYLGGILSSLTPCVYPMIPITVSVVGGIGPAKRSWQEVWLRGAAYVAGMALIYSFLGVAAGLTGKVFGTLTNTSGWYLGLGIVMSLAALMMMDIIQADPAMWWDQLKRKLYASRPGSHVSKAALAGPPKEVSFMGAFALGASSGFIAAPCTTPVLTSILAYIAKTQSVGLGLALMLAFSLGLGTILLLIATFAGALQLMPRSGKWMQKVKVGSGLLLLAFADYLFYRAGQIG